MLAIVSSSFSILNFQFSIHLVSRVSLKVVGASGQGIDSVGEILAKALKRSGYCVFGYREYPSLIKGGHASYQLDVDGELVRSSEDRLNIIVGLNHHVFEHNLPELKQGGLLIHSTPVWEFSAEDQTLLKDRKISVIYIPIDDILKKLNAKPILGNVVLAAFVWAVLEQDVDELKKMVGERFKKKKDLLDLNMQCIDAGNAYEDPRSGKIRVTMPRSAKKWAKQMLLTGSKAMALGAVHAGVRLYAGYPMTPSSPLLTYIAGMQNQTGMIIKQAEDEITAAQIVSGAMFAGTRALTATSGGGFDLMSETVSLNGIIENPTVFVLAQRPGPATGLPTWTAQGELLYSIYTAHGECARCVLAVSDSQDAFDLMPEAFNLAEEYQIPVLVLTDKHIAEALFTQVKYDLKKAALKRGKLVTEPKELKKLKATDRYDPTAKNGVSPRWLPGSEAATYCAQGDEHNADGTVDETAKNATEQLEKRVKKMTALEAQLPEPELFSSEKPDVLLVSWGSNKGVILDALESEELKDQKIGYLHYAYLWPLKTQKLQSMMKSVERTILIECNFTGQLGVLMKQQAGLAIADRILKYDGRPFFLNELVKAISGKLQSVSVKMKA